MLPPSPVYKSKNSVQYWRVRSFFCPEKKRQYACSYQTTLCHILEHNDLHYKWRLLHWEFWRKKFVGWQNLEPSSTRFTYPQFTVQQNPYSFKSSAYVKVKLKVKLYPCNSLWRPVWLSDVEDQRWGCQSYAPVVLYSQRDLLIRISVRGWVKPRA
jgi:hypothetical protein